MNPDAVVAQLEQTIFNLKTAPSHELWEYARALAVDIERRIEILRHAHQELANDPDEGDVVRSIKARIQQLEEGLSRIAKLALSNTA